MIHATGNVVEWALWRRESEVIDGVMTYETRTTKEQPEGDGWIKDTRAHWGVRHTAECPHPWAEKYGMEIGSIKEDYSGPVHPPGTIEDITDHGARPILLMEETRERRGAAG